MKKLSLLLGTLGGAFAGYLFSNKKLREELTSSKDAEHAAKTLGKHLQKDGKKLAKQVREFVESEEVQGQIGTAKKYAKEKFDEAKTELNDMMHKGSNAAKKTAKRATKSAKKTVKKAAKKAAKKVAKKASARKPARVKTKTRTVS